MPKAMQKILQSGLVGVAMVASGFAVASTAPPQPPVIDSEYWEITGGGVV